MKYLLVLMLAFLLHGCADTLVKQTMAAVSPFIAKMGKVFYDRNNNLDTEDNETEKLKRNKPCWFSTYVYFNKVRSV